MGKTFLELSTVPSIKIDRCAQMLPNKMQCWRPGAWLVQEASPQGAEASASKKDDPQKDKEKSAPSKGGEGTKPPKESPAKGGKETEGGGTEDTTSTQPHGYTQQSEKQPGAASGMGANVSSASTSGVTTDQGVTSYQLCNTHKIIAEKAAQEAEKSGKSVDEVHAKMMGNAQTFMQSHMPQAIEERPKEEHVHRWGRF